MTQYYSRVTQEKQLKISPLSNEVLEVNVHNISAVYIGEGEDRRLVRRYTTEPCRGGFICPLCSMKDPLINMVPQKMRYDSRGNERHFDKSRKYAILCFDHEAMEPRIFLGSKTAVSAIKDLIDEGQDITNFSFKIKYSKPAYQSSAIPRLDTEIDLSGIDTNLLLDRMRHQFDVDYRKIRTPEELAMAIDPTSTEDHREPSNVPPPPPQHAAPPPSTQASPESPEDVATPSSSSTESKDSDEDIAELKRDLIMLVAKNGNRFQEINDALRSIGVNGINDIPDSAVKESLDTVRKLVEG